MFGELRGSRLINMPAWPPIDFHRATVKGWLEFFRVPLTVCEQYVVRSNRDVGRDPRVNPSMSKRERNRTSPSDVL